MNKHYYVHAMEYYLAIKRNINITTWMKLGNIILSEKKLITKYILWTYTYVQNRPIHVNIKMICGY